MMDRIFPLESDDATFKDGPMIKERSDSLVQISQNLNRPLTAAKSHEERMIAAGFEHVVVNHFNWLTNPWPKEKKHKEVGMWTLANIGEGLKGVEYGFTHAGTWLVEGAGACVSSCCEGACEELEDPCLLANVSYSLKTLASEFVG